MGSISRFGFLGVAAIGLAACGGQQSADETAVPTAGETIQPPATPYKPVATLPDLMRGTLTFAAEKYWESVAIVVDADGVHENHPETEAEWIEVWSAGMTLAEAGNLLMMPPRAIDNGDWIRLATDLVDVGLHAAKVAIDEDFEGVLAAGEQIYNVCVECHQLYVPTLNDL